MAKVKLARGVQSAYNTKNSNNQLDSDTLYVCTDTGNIYLGTTVLFESSAYLDSSISGKIVTFTTHGAAGTHGSDTLDLSIFQTASDVSSAIAAAISSVYKPAGSATVSNGEIPDSWCDGVLVAGNVGNVYNVPTSCTIRSVYVIEGTEISYQLRAGENIVVIEQYEAASGTAQSGVTYYTRSGSAEPYTYAETSPQPSVGASVSGLYTKVYKFDVLAGLVDMSGYQQVVSGATDGNFAGLNASGQITDSGYKPGDFKPKQTAVNDPSANGTTLTAIATLSQNADGVISATKKTIQDGTTSQKGVVQLEDSTSSTSTTKAATPNSVKSAYDLAAGKVSDVKIGISSIVDSNHVANIVTETAYNASTNKIATMADVSGSELEWGSF